MSDRKVALVEGKITFDDGETVEFMTGGETDSRWGNTTEVLGDSVDVVETIRVALDDRGLFAPLDEVAPEDEFERNNR